VAPPKGRTKIASETKTLRSHDGREITLSAFRGQSVVLAFFAFAFTGT